MTTNGAGAHSPENIDPLDRWNVPVKHSADHGMHSGGTPGAGEIRAESWRHAAAGIREDLAARAEMRRLGVRA